MSEETNLHDALPDPVEDFDVTVEKQDEGWAVIKTANGESSVIKHHADEESARAYAAILVGVAVRNEGAHREEEVPDSYPGKGVDETGGMRPESPGA